MRPILGQKASILKTMYSAASGLMAHSAAISVASDNIANVNTVGFKSHEPASKMYLEAQSLVPLITKPQGSVRLGGVHTVWTQWFTIGSRNNTDMAIRATVSSLFKVPSTVFKTVSSTVETVSSISTMKVCW